MAMQIADAQRHPDGVLGELLSRWTDHRSLFLQAARGERYVRGDRNIEGLDVLGDPIVGHVGASRDDDVTDSRIGTRPYADIGENMDNEAMTIGDTLDLGFDRA